MQNALPVKIEKMFFLNGDGPTKAFCNVMLFDSFVVKGLRVIEGKEGLFVGMPSDQGKDGKWYETFSPTTKPVRKELEKYILEKYEERYDEKKPGQ